MFTNDDVEDFLFEVPGLSIWQAWELCEQWKQWSSRKTDLLSLPPFPQKTAAAFSRRQN